MTAANLASTAPPASSYNVFPTRGDEVTRSHLEQLSCLLMNGLQDRNWNDPVFIHLAPNLYAIWDGFPVCNSREQYLDNIDATMRASPNFCSEILLTSSTIRGVSKRKATVWITVRLGGLPLIGSEGLEREAVFRHDWRRRTEGWQCVQITALRGSSPIARGC